MAINDNLFTISLTVRINNSKLRIKTCAYNKKYLIFINLRIKRMLIINYIIIIRETLIIVIII